MVDYSKASLATNKPVDKTAYTLEGSFVYSYTTSDSGGSHTVANPAPGNIFFADSIFSIDGGDTWFSDLDKSFGGNYPDILSCVTANNIIFRYGSYGPAGTSTVIYKTKLLVLDI